MNPMPLFHTAGCGMGVLGAAQSLAVHVPVLAFDPALVLELLREGGRAAVFGGVPTMMIAMLGHPDFERRDLSCLRAAMSGGAPVPAELVRQVEARLGIPVSIVFGSTECSPLLTQVKPDDSAQDRAETLGTPLPQTEIKIADIAAGGHRAGGAGGRAVRPRVPGHAWLSRRPRGHGGRHRRRGVVSHRGPGLPRRPRLPADRGPDQGDDHPGRGEHLPTRDRGCPIRPPRRRRGSGCRRPGPDMG